MSTVVDRMKKLCPELGRLPNGWTFKVTTTEEKRIYFQKDSTRDTTFNHPTLGGLPVPWILRLSRDANDEWSVTYYNRDTKTNTTDDPRYMANSLALQSRSVAKSLSIAARTTKNNPNINLNDMKRAPIQSTDIRSQFELMHTIDPGDGTIGGMNGGVFVVRMKGLPSRLFVEKRFKAADVEFGQKEIQLLYKLKHWSLTFYAAAFILPNLKAASVYVEFCDRGSLEELIKKYAAKLVNTSPKPEVPEPFIWHAFTGLCDGLAYLRGGRSFVGQGNLEADPNWEPILHRDIKPDNVLLRSRATLGSNSYFYCVLSDFGLACPLSGDEHQRARVKLGTKTFWAPELCYNPYPQTDNELRVFPGGYQHSRFSDVWALGASMYNLCVSDGKYGSLAHIDMTARPAGMSIDLFWEGTRSRKAILKIPSSYSTKLQAAILISTKWDPGCRPDAIKLVRLLQVLMEKSGFAAQNAKNERDNLPSWATKVHEYHSTGEKESKNVRSR